MTLAIRVLVATVIAMVIALAPQETAAASKDRQHITDGPLGLYTVVLREDVVAAQNAADEAPARSTRDPQNEHDFYGWQKPKARKLVKRMEKDYGVKAISMTSYTLPTFTAYMLPPTLAGISSDPRVERVEPVYADDDDYSSWSDYTSGGETVPWGRQAVGADDGYSGLGSPNIVYMIDGVALIDGSDTQSNSDLNITVIHAVNNQYVTDPFYRSSQAAAPGHANHVAGIIGAYANGTGVRGVSPGIHIISVIKGGPDNEVQAAINWTLADAQQQLISPVVNISSSGARWAAGGALYTHLQALKSQMLVVQAAGNNARDACQDAYGPPDPNDGYLVVGGIDQYGARAENWDNSASRYQNEPGSNYGSCVEVWAPAKNIWSTWNRNATDTMILSGTSMAAPHVTAIAARYGNNVTAPADREHYIRSRLFATGYSDPTGQPIRVPSVAPRADVSVVQSASPSSALTGRDVAFTVTAINNGPDATSSVTKYITYDPGATFVWASADCTRVPNVANVFSCAAGSLGVNAQHSSKVVVRRDSGTYVANSVSLSSATIDPVTSNDGNSLLVPLSASNSASIVNRYRLYNPGNGDHLYTIDANEYNVLPAYGWQQEGTQAHSLNNPGSYNGVAAVPFYRAYNPGSGFHLWTDNPYEYYTLVSWGWGGEGAFEFILPSQAAGTIPLYRLSDPYGRHLWTIDANEYNYLSTHGWGAEGVAGYVIP